MSSGSVLTLENGALLLLGIKELEMRKTAKGTSVTVPRLEVHSMVVGEFEAAAQR
jgi:hypothetical protein